MVPSLLFCKAYGEFLVSFTMHCQNMENTQTHFLSTSLMPWTFCASKFVVYKIQTKASTNNGSEQCCEASFKTILHSTPQHITGK
jgi:hypothetical protein